jgi:hypothetical protein
VPAHAAGTVDVIVTTPTGKSPAVSGDKYTYDAVPTVSAISPASGPRATVVTVTGTGFAAGAKVSFGSIPAAKVKRVSNTSLQVTAPAGSGVVPVTVTRREARAPPRRLISSRTRADRSRDRADAHPAARPKREAHRPPNDASPRLGLTHSGFGAPLQTAEQARRSYVADFGVEKRSRAV